MASTGIWKLRDNNLIIETLKRWWESNSTNFTVLDVLRTGFKTTTACPFVKDSAASDVLRTEGILQLEVPQPDVDDPVDRSLLEKVCVAANLLLLLRREFD